MLIIILIIVISIITHNIHILHLFFVHILKHQWNRTVCPDWKRFPGERKLRKTSEISQIFFVFHIFCEKNLCAISPFRWKFKIAVLYFYSIRHFFFVQDEKEYILISLILLFSPDLLVLSDR